MPEGSSTRALRVRKRRVRNSVFLSTFNCASLSRLSARDRWLRPSPAAERTMRPRQDESDPLGGPRGTTRALRYTTKSQRCFALPSRNAEPRCRWRGFDPRSPGKGPTLVPGATAVPRRCRPTRAFLARPEVQSTPPRAKTITRRADTRVSRPENLIGARGATFGAEKDHERQRLAGYLTRNGFGDSSRPDHRDDLSRGRYESRRRSG